MNHPLPAETPNKSTDTDAPKAFYALRKDDTKVDFSYIK